MATMYSTTRPLTCGCQCELATKDGAAACVEVFIAVAVANLCHASLAQLAEHALRKRMVAGSIPAGGFVPAGCPLAAQEMCFWLVNIQRRRANVPAKALRARRRLPSQPQLMPLPLLPLPQLPLLPAQQ